jgi:hypothetical protein
MGAGRLLGQGRLNLGRIEAQVTKGLLKASGGYGFQHPIFGPDPAQEEFLETPLQIDRPGAIWVCDHYQPLRGTVGDGFELVEHLNVFLAQGSGWIGCYEPGQTEK